MSIMLCNGCDALIDTDFNVEGMWEPEYRCESCTDELSQEACETEAQHCGVCMPCLARISYGEPA